MLKIKKYLRIIIEFFIINLKNIFFILDTFTKYNDLKFREKSKRNIFAFIDLESTRSNFDVAVYLVYLKTLEIIDNKIKINIIILPDGDTTGVKISYQKEDKKKKFFMHLRHNNLTFKCINMIENFHPNTFFLSNRKEADKIYSLPNSQKIPKKIHKYKPTQAINYYIKLKKIYSKHNKIARLVANENYKKLVKEYLKINNIKNNKLVTITLRNSSYRKFRNADNNEWKKVYLYLKKNGYYPLIIHDFENACLDNNPFEKFNTYQYANLDIDVRLALYEIAFINFGSGSGSSLLLQLSKNCKFLDFNIYNKEYLKTAYDIANVTLDEHFPWYKKNQKFIWIKKFSHKNIIKHFEKYLKGN